MRWRWSARTRDSGRGACASCSRATTNARGVKLWTTSEAEAKGNDMSQAETLYGDEHVRRYRETGGEVDHIWRRGAKILLLTTNGRRTGKPRTTPLIYEQDGDAYIIIASKGGAPEHPGWYRNLAKNPQVELQVRDRVFPAHAHTATGEERERLWKLAASQWPDYDQYQKETDREIPVVVLEPTERRS
jgi:deazaflavin-dependent oxidoreductase (nitroreductase family)